MDAFLLQLLNGLDKGGAYALIALGLTLIFGTLGVVNFAHGTLFMLGAFCAVAFYKLLNISERIKDESVTFFDSYKEVPYLRLWFGDAGDRIIDYSVPLSLALTIPVMLGIGIVIERGIIRHFYRRTTAEQILMTFGLAIVLQETIKAVFGTNPIPIPAPSAMAGSVNLGLILGLGSGPVYPAWRLVYLLFAIGIISAVFAFLRFTTFGMVVRAGMRDREMVGLLGINIEKRFTIVFGIATVIAGVAGAMYAPILAPDYHMGSNFLVLSFVVVVVGGMGSLEGAVLAGFLLGIVQSFAALNQVKDLVPAVDQVIIYAIAVIVLLTRPRGLLGRKGLMEG